MSNLEKMLNAWNEADVELNKKIVELKTNLLSPVVASSNASASNAKVLDFQGTGKNLEKLVIEGKTVQNGTPSPSAPVEVKGVGDGGWNVIPSAKKETKSLNGVTIESDGLGTYTLSGTATAETFITFNIDEFVTPKSISNNGKGCLYFFNNKTFLVSSEMVLDFMYKDQKVDGWSFTPLNRVSYTYNILGEKQVDAIRFHIWPNITTNFLCKPMMTNDGKTDHEFVPYGKYEIPISVGDKSNSIYLNAPLFNGETLDTELGKVSKNYKVINANDVSWVLNSKQAFWGVKDDSLAVPSSTSAPDAFSNAYVRKPDSTIASSNAEFCITKDGLFVSVFGDITNPPHDCYFVCRLKSTVEESFTAPEISTSVGKNTLTVGTDVTPAKIEATSFGEYYNKSEVDKMLAEKIIGKVDSTADATDHGEIFNSYDGSRINKATGKYSHAEGSKTVASASYSHAEGAGNEASGNASHAEGGGTEASGNGSHAEGMATTAFNIASHAEGSETRAIGEKSHAEGDGTTAEGESSHAEGSGTTASGKNSHAEGTGNKASGIGSHAEGSGTTASGYVSHAEGSGTTASAYISHAEGYYTTASAEESHAEGYYTTASNFSSHASGKYNASMTTGGASNNTTGTAFVIGNGTSSSAKSNAFSVQYTGVVKAKSTITASTTADYAEFFEWEDGNICSEDRIGHFVTLDGNKIRIATDEDDYILGVVSGEPFVLGNGDCDTWNGMYLRDEFRRTKYEPAPKMEEVLDEDGKPTGEYKEVEGEYEGTRPILNPDYDNTKPYVSRFDRDEWAPVGMLGVLAVYHDGTARVNGYVTVNKDGIATACEKSHENSYRVIKSNTEDVVEIIFR